MSKKDDQADDKTPKDAISWLVKARYEEDQSSPPGHQALNEDGRLMIIARSDTTGTTLAHVLYYLPKTPRALKTLYKELDTTFSTTSPSSSEFPNDNLQFLPYLEAIISDILRLKPAVPSGQPRTTPSQSLQIDEVWIPGNTIVVIPQYVLQRDKRWFPSGEEFSPERWLGTKSELVKHEEAFFPFHLGRYGCDGKQLALMQLRAVIARIAFDVDLEFAEGEDGVAFDQGSMDTFTLTLGALRVVF